MTLFDMHLALESLQWRNIELLQALRVNTVMSVAPYSKQPLLPEDLYPLASDVESGGNVNVKQGLERAKERVLAFNEGKVR